MPSLLEILNDPNYVNANEATKEAIFNKYSAQDKNYTDANDATKEAIRNKFGIGAPAAVAKPEPTKDTGIFSMAGRALARGAKQTGSLLGDVLPAMAASAVGADEYAARQMAEAAETQKEIEQKYGARYKSLEDVKGIGDYLPFALETALEQVPGMATALVPGAGLGAVGGRMAATAAAKKLAEREAATQAGARYAGMKTAEGAMRGQIGGAFLGSYALNAPEVFQNIFEETGGQMEPAAAALAGSISAALDSILPVAILRQLGPNVKAGVVENLLEKSGMPSPLARKVVGATVTGAGTEGLTEGAQEAISIAAEKFVQENPEVWGSKEFNRLIESSVRGAVGGGAFGAAGAGAGAYLEGRRERLEQRQLDADRREIIAGDLATQLGRDPTEEEIDTVVAATNRARKEMQDESTSIDTRTGEPSVSVPSQEELGKGPVDTGAPELTETDLDRINRLAADAGVREEDVYDQLKKDEQQKAEGTVLTPDAETLLKSVEAGGTPAMMTNNLKRIAKENGIEVTAKDTPNSVIEKLQALKTTPAKTPSNVVDFNKFRAEKESAISRAAPEIMESLGIQLDKLQQLYDQNLITNADLLELKQSFEKYDNDALMAISIIKKKVDSVTKKPELKAAAAKKTKQPVDTSGVKDLVEGKTRTFQGYTIYKRKEDPDFWYVQSPENKAANKIGAGDEVSTNLDTAKSKVEQYGIDAQSVSKPRLSKKAEAEARKKAEADEDEMFNQLAAAESKKGPTQLNAEQVSKQLVSPSFAPLTAETSEFFAKSKVRDADGRLIPLLHGTNATGPKGEGLTQIKLSKEGSLGGGIYLTPIPLIANNYTGIPTPEAIDALEVEGRTPQEVIDKLRAMYKTGELAPAQVGGNVIPVFVDIQNPLVINTTDRRFDPAVDLLVALDVPRDKAETIVEKAQEDKGGITKEIMTRARAKGYDGILQYRDGELAEVVAFSPSQVKSVFNKDPSRLPELLNAFDRAENTSPKKEQVSLNDPLFSPAHPTVTKAIANNDVQGALRALKNTAGKFLAGLADRLMQLNLNTVVGFDDLHYDLSIKSLDRVKGQKTRILNWLQQVKPAVYASRFDESKMKMPVTETLKAFEDFRDGKLGIDPKMFKEDLEDIIKVYDNAVTSLNAPGTYFMDDNAIGLSLTRGGNSNYAIAHEFTHSATHWAIDHSDELNPKQRLALANLYRLFRYAKKHTKNPAAYGYNNLHEFVAEAFSRPSFQNELRQMQRVMDTDMSAWSKFIQLVAQLFGVDNVLFHTLANADVLFSANSGSATNKGPGLLWAPSRYSVRNGTFKLNPGERIGFIDKAIQLRKNWKSVDKSNLKNFFGSLNNQYRRYLLGALTVDQLADIYGSDMPQLKAYVKEVDAMLATRNAILKEGAPIIGRWSNLLQSNPEKAKQLGQVMIESTLEKMDPSILDPQLQQILSKKDLPELLAKYDSSSLKDAWREMSSGKDGDVAVEIYKQVRNFYERRMNEYIQVQEARIREAGLAKSMTPQEIDAKVRAFRAEIEESIIRPYFPIKRFGDYFLMVGRGRNKIFMQFEDAFARDAELEKQRARLLKTQVKDKDTGETRTYTEEEAAAELWPGQGFNEVLNQKLNEVTQLNKIKALVDETTEDILKSTDPQIMQDRVAAMQEQLKDAFGQYYLELLPSESIKKMFLHRQNVAGPSQDMLRAFSLSYERIAYQRARFQHMPSLFNIVEAAKLRSMSMPTTEEKAVYGDVANELAKQFKSGVLEPPKHSKLTTFLTHFGFLNFLTSPASAVVNMMAIPGLYIPVAGSRYGGVKRVGTVVSKYVRMLGGTGYINEETNRYEFLSLARANLQTLTDVNTRDGANKINLPKGKTLADVYTAGVNRGAIDTTLVHDSVSIGESPSEDYTGRWQKFMYYASLPFHAAEKFNREVSYMTSFELAYEKNITDKKMTPEAAFEAALDQARDLTQETMFNYNSTNKPRYFRGNISNVLLQFKLYPQHMCVLMFRTFQKGFMDGEKAELDAIRAQLQNAPEDVLNKALADKRAELAGIKKEARDAFLGMMGMSFLTAGMTGMPLWFIFSGVASAFHAVFGDDDEPFDADNWFKNWANRTFGGFAGDTISRGLLSQVTGMNFADRMNLNLPDMWFPDVRKSQSEVDYVQNMFINTLGPSLGALLVSYPEAVKRFNDGHTERAVEALMPAGIKNVMVGTRYMVEGQALTLKGNTLVEDISAREALSQMLGFSPERVAQKQQAAFATKNANETIMNRRTDLLNAFFIAVDTGDANMMAKVIDKMIAFSQTNPGVAIDPDKLVDSIEKRYKDRALANMTGGMGLNKNLIPQLLPMLEYGER